MTAARPSELTPIGRGKKRLGNAAPAAARKKPQARRTRTNIVDSCSRLSTLESLPTELIEQIFLCFPTPSLLRAAPIIALKLSSEHVYKQICDKYFRAFIQYQKDSTTYSVNEGLLIPHSEDDLISIRNGALRWRWMTTSRYHEMRQRVLDEEKERLRDAGQLEVRLLTGDTAGGGSC